MKEKNEKHHLNSDWKQPSRKQTNKLKCKQRHKLIVVVVSLTFSKSSEEMKGIQ